MAALLFLTRLGAPLVESQESRYAEIPRQMLLEGQACLDRPPLLYWLVMASYKVFGIHDWAARLVPGLAGAATVLITFWWGRRALGERAGLCAAMVLCLSPEFVYRARMLTTDTLLCLWVVAALACAHAALAGPVLRRGWWLAAATACGLGLLTAGPVALVLVVVPVAVYCFLDLRCPKIRIAEAGLFLATALVMAVPWLTAVAANGNLSPLDPEMRGWLYLPGLLAGLLPWTVLVPGLVRFLARRSWRCAIRRPAGLGLALLAVGWCLALYLAGGCQRVGCILCALLPPLALALGCYLDVLIVRHRSEMVPAWAGLWRRASRLAGQATVAVLLLGLVLATYAGLRQLIRPNVGLLLAAAALTALVAVRRRRAVSWGACGLAAFAVVFLSVWYLQPAYNRQFALRGRVRTDTDLAQGAGLSVVCFPQRWDSVRFYLPRADVRVYGLAQWQELVADLRSRPRTLLLVQSGPVLRDLLRDLPDSVEFTPRGRPGAVTAGWVRLRQEAPPFLYARHQPARRASPWRDDPAD
jgi:dolichol-phosphate mannosyltransferase